MTAQEKEQEWDQQKGQVPAKHLAPRFLRASARARKSGLVLVHLSPLGLESALQSALGLETRPGMVAALLDLGLALGLVLAMGSEMALQKALAWG